MKPLALRSPLSALRVLLGGLLFSVLCPPAPAQQLIGDLIVQRTEKVGTVATGTITPGTIGADQNDYNPANLATAATLRLATDASRTLTGLVPGATPGGRRLALYNVGSFPLVLANESAASAAANRFALAAAYTIPAGGGVLLQYDGTSFRWRLAGAGPMDLGSILPAQAGNANSYLYTSGTAASWRDYLVGAEGSVAVDWLNRTLNDATEATVLNWGTKTLATGWALGTPASGNAGNLTALNATQLTTGTVPLARLYTTAAGYGITGGAALDSWAGLTRAAGFDTFTATPTGANLAGLLTSALPASKGGTGLTALGTGVATALGINTGSAGAFILYNGGLGTPTSGDISSASLTYRSATTSATGAVELSTTAEMLQGISTTLAPPVSAVEARALHGDFTRQIRDSLYSDGATSNRRLTVATNGTITSASEVPLTLLADFLCPASGVGTLVAVQSDDVVSPGISVNGVGVYWETAAVLSIIQWRGYTVQYRRLKWNGFTAAYAGRWVRLAVVIPANSTNNPVVYANSVDITANFSAGSASAPNWLPTSDWTPSRVIHGGALAATSFVPHAPILGALTAAEVLDWTQTGRLPTWCEIGTGRAVAKYTSDFSAGVDSWALTHAGNVVTGNVDGIGGQDDNLQLLTGAGDATGGMSRANAFPALGRKYRITLSVFAPAANTSKTIRITDGAATTAFSGVSDTVLAADTWTTITVEGTVSSTTLAFRAINAAITDNFYIRAVSVLELGPIFKPVIQPGVALWDAGSNNLPGILTSGITPLTSANRGTLTATLTWAGTHEGKSLLGAQALPTNAIITRIWRKATVASSGSGCTIGTTTSATRWQALDTYTTAAEIVTLANQLPAGTAANDLDIVVDPDTANYTGSITVTVEYQIVGGTP